MRDINFKPWWHNKVIYQVYPRSFYDSNGDGFGDIRGIIQKLDYIVDLGVDIVWISPFFKSPQRDFGYDVSSYLDVSEEYGTLNEIFELIEAAHAKGLKVMFDLVLNHTSDEHPWFIEANSSKDNPKSDWYVFADGKGSSGKKHPNNWRCDLQLKSGWQWSKNREQFYFATFLPFQPDLNWRNQELKSEMFSMIQFWLKKGVDGFRLDIFGAIMKDEKLRSNKFRPSIDPNGPHLIDKRYTLNTSENFQLAYELRAKCDEINPQAVLIGEVFGSDKVLKNYLGENSPSSISTSPTVDGVDEGFTTPGLNLVFLFDFLTFKYSAEFFRNKINNYEKQFPDPLQPTYVFENHDRSRLMGRLNNNVDKARNLALLQLTLRGVVTLYQGQEIGMENTYIPLKKAQDPIARDYFYWIPEVINKRITERLNRDEVRTPMQWNAEDNGGFTTAKKPWLMVNSNYRRLNVFDQQNDPRSLINLYKNLLDIRKRNKAFSGSLKILESENTDVLMYLRNSQDQEAVICINFSDNPAEIKVESKKLIFSNNDKCLYDDGLLKLPPNTGVILVTR